MKRKTSALASILFKEMVRDKLFLTFALGAVALVLSTLILNDMVVGEPIKATKDLGLTLLNLFPLCMILFLGLGQVSRDINQKTLYPILAKGATRSHYIGAAMIAITAAMTLAIIMLALVIQALAMLQHDSLLPGLLIAMLLTFFEMLIVLACGLLFAVLTTSQLAMFLTLLVYIAGHAIERAAEVIGHSPNSWSKPVIGVLYAIMPNLEFFNRKAALIYRNPISGQYLAKAALYALAYASLFMLLAIWRFKRREL